MFKLEKVLKTRKNQKLKLSRFITLEKRIYQNWDHEDLIKLIFKYPDHPTCTLFCYEREYNKLIDEINNHIRIFLDGELYRITKSIENNNFTGRIITFD